MSEMPNDKAYFIDLRKIRKQQGLSDEDISARTLITLDIIQSFEETGLLNHPRFNRVYLRALVQSYADALGVDLELARRAFDETINGNYDGFLARKYIEGKSLEEPATVPPAKPIEAKEPLKKPRNVSAESERSGAVRISKSPPSAAPVPAQAPKQAERKQEHRIPEGPRSRTPKEPFRLEKPLSPPRNQTEPIRPNVFKLEEPAPRTDKTKPGKEPLSVSRSSPFLKLGTIASVVIILAIITWFALDYISRPPEPTRIAQEQIQEQDESALAEAESQVPEGPSFVLPDSVRLVVVAARGTLSPVSVTVDGEEYLRWVEARDSVSFYTRSGFTLSGGARTLGRINLRVEGRPWALPQSDTLSTFTVTRNEIQSVLSSR